MRAEEIAEADESEKTLIVELATAAKLYLAGAGVERTESNKALYDLAMHSLTLHYYDHRDAVGNEASFPIGLRPVLTQLKLSAAAEASS